MKKKGEINNRELIFVIIVVVIILIVGFVIFSINNSTPDENDDSGNAVNESSDEVNEPIEVINQTIETIEPPPVIDMSFGDSLRFAIKASNPQYKKEQDITIQYTLENKGNETVTIPLDVANGIEIKNSAGNILDYSGSEGGVMILTESQSIEAGKIMSGSFIIPGDDYDLTTIGSAADGYYNSVIAHIGDVDSNKVIVRIISTN